jgi:hypothetical protein
VDLSAVSRPLYNRQLTADNFCYSTVTVVRLLDGEAGFLS